MIQHAAAPVVSIGVPVYNGASSIASALDSLVGQTFDRMEIIISDNASTDRTPAICQRYASQDPRIRYIRQTTLLSAAKNFAFVRALASGPYFMWAAHDDTRDPDFVERLLEALERNPHAVLAMGDIIEIREGTSRRLSFDFETLNLGRAARLRKAALSQCYHIYGLWRLDALRRIEVGEGGWWPDTPMMMAGACLGDYIHVPGTFFRYRFNARSFFPQDDAGGRALSFRLLMRLLRRGLDLPQLVWSAGRTVAAVTGPLSGILAGCFALEKVARQIPGFAMRRLKPRWS